MNTHRTVVLMASGLLFFALQGIAQNGRGMGQRAGGNGAGSCQTALAGLPLQEMSSTEISELTYMREEEKLARDVYARLYEAWGSRVFGSIAQSEQRHFEALKALLDRYGLPDPAATDVPGTFSEGALQVLYNDLITQGRVSLAGALRVGTTIEDLDIRDLEQAIAATDNADLKQVYGNLERGSRNHMRAFVSQLELLGETYDAQYISSSFLELILSSPQERGTATGWEPAAGAGVVRSSAPGDEVSENRD
jgi:hypothetical protein